MTTVSRNPAVAVRALVEAFRDAQAGWWSRLNGLALAGAMLVCAWFVLSLGLPGPGTGF